MWSTESGRQRRPRVATVVLAAGASTRFHGYPKACLRVGDESAVRRIARLALSAGSSPVVVVTGPHAPEIARALDGVPVRLVHHPEWSSGRTSSVQAGLGHVPAGDDVLVWPVDHPFVDQGTLARMTAARAQDDLAVWFIPMYLGRGGHPVLLRSEAIDQVRALAPEEPMRGLLPWLGAQVRRVSVPDPGVVEDVDTPEEYRRYLEAWRSRWTGD
jgi:molybdenum cofactor cytidylyltransferase